jgi:23S rRNA pseudouridine1911/1915/1917 synthase
MKYIGHPIFNDANYGGDQILKGTLFSKYKQFVQNCFKIMPRHALHAKTLGFIHPRTEKIIKLNSDVPADFKQVLAKWKRYINYIED